MKIIKKFSFLVVVLLMLILLNVPSTKAVGETFDDINGAFPKVTVTAENRYQLLMFDNVDNLDKLEKANLALLMFKIRLFINIFAKSNCQFSVR